MWNYTQDLLPTNNKQFLVFKHQAGAYVFNKAIYFNNNWWVMQSDEGYIAYTQDPSILKQQILDISTRAGQESNEIIGWLEPPDNYINLLDFILKGKDDQETKGNN